jgi:hypothetical protein
MPYTIIEWDERNDFGGPVFYATVGEDTYKVSGINYYFGRHHLHEVIVWRNGVEVAYRKDTADALAVFHDYLNTEGINV